MESSSGDLGTEVCSSLYVGKLLVHIDSAADSLQNLQCLIRSPPLRQAIGRVR